MSLGSRIKEARQQLGITQEQLAGLIGVSKGAIGNYESETAYPKTEILYKLFEALHCDANYLYQDDMKAMREFRVTLPEQKMLKMYRSLDEHGKDLIDTILEKEISRCTSESPQPGMISSIKLRRYTSPAAAGAPLYAESDYEDVDFPAEIVPDGTSYALSICGKSMEPEIPDGCTVFVEKTEAVCDGDIIVAWIEGDGSVCKRVVMDGDQVVRLESANRKYGDITGEDLNGMRVYGKVLGYTKE